MGDNEDGMMNGKMDIAKVAMVPQMAPALATNADAGRLKYDKVDAARMLSAAAAGTIIIQGYS